MNISFTPNILEIMALFYKSRQSTIKSKDGKKKYHPQLVKIGKTVTTQQLAERIAEMSSLTPGDVHNCIRNLSSVIDSFLLQSKSVNLEGLGTFTVISKSGSKGVDTPEEVSPSQISHLKVQFTPSYTRAAGTGHTRTMFQGVEYVRYDPAGKKSGEPVDPDA